MLKPNSKVASSERETGDNSSLTFAIESFDMMRQLANYLIIRSFSFFMPTNVEVITTASLDKGNPKFDSEI